MTEIEEEIAKIEKELSEADKEIVKTINEKNKIKNKNQENDKNYMYIEDMEDKKEDKPTWYDDVEHGD